LRASRTGVAAGDLPGHADPELAALALLGPLFYRRLMSAEPFPPDRNLVNRSARSTVSTTTANRAGQRQVSPPGLAASPQVRCCRVQHSPRTRSRPDPDRRPHRSASGGPRRKIDHRQVVSNATMLSRLPPGTSAPATGPHDLVDSGATDLRRMLHPLQYGRFCIAKRAHDVCAEVGVRNSLPDGTPPSAQITAPATGQASTSTGQVVTALDGVQRPFVVALARSPRRGWPGDQGLARMTPFGRTMMDSLRETGATSAIDHRLR
jgi:hypothetical protein